MLPAAPYNRSVSLELIVDPSASGELPQKTVSVMLWSTVAGDPVLVDAKAFTNAADLRVWLKEIAARHGAANISVRWTNRLRSSQGVCKLIAACLGVDAPLPDPT